MTEIRFKTNINASKKAAVKAVIEQLEEISVSAEDLQRNIWAGDSKARKTPKKI